MNRETNFILNGRVTSINLRNLSFNDSFLSRYKREYKYLDHPITRRKIYDAFTKMQQGYPNNDIPSNEIRSFCQLLITSFYRSSLTQMTELFENPTIDFLDNISLRAGKYLSKGIGVENVSVVFDQRKMNSPIRVYIDALRDLETDIVANPLDYKMENGFFKFIAPENVHITVFVSLSYLRNLMNTHYDTIIRDEYGVAKDSGDIDNYYIFEGDNYFRVEDMVRRIWKDFLGAFTIAIYKDSFREKIYSYFYIFFHIFMKENKNFSASFLSNGSSIALKSTLKMYGEDLKRISKTINTSKKSTDEVNINHIEQIYDDNYNVQAFDLYLALFEPLTDEIRTLRSRLNFFDAIAGISANEHVDSRLDDLNRDFINGTCNLAATNILLSRILPLLIINEIFSQSFKYRDLSQFIDKIHQAYPFTSMMSMIGNNYQIESIGHLGMKIIQMKDFVKQGSKIFVNGIKLRRFIEAFNRYLCSNTNEFESQLDTLLSEDTIDRTDLEDNVL